MKRMRLLVTGAVQGVGFRPFIYRLARRHRLCGYVANTSIGVDIDVQGDEKDLAEFQQEIILQKPERSSIDSLQITEAELTNYQSFVIQNSQSASETALALLPDTGICPKCLSEFDDPSNRRYRYPFIHCMTCGPRFSLFLRMPFDRKNTSMVDFPMCSECQNEYDNPDNRRFYSQTTCCPVCGPKLILFDAQKNQIAQDLPAIDAAIDALCQGKIVAMKNTGGYLLLADATNERTIKRLRAAKRRERKPFALLMNDLSQARESAIVSPAAEAVLISPASPIVLLPKLTNSEIVPSVSFETPYLGVMLAHHALQHMIMRGVRRPLAATSGNVSNHPICIAEEAAFSDLSGIADLFLTHNRRIIHRLDDSVVHMIMDRPMIIRRARGYIPHAFSLKNEIECTLAAGSQMKNTFAIAKGKHIYISQHIGDLDSSENCEAYERELESFKALLQISPASGVGDLHPDYYSSIYLSRQPIKRSSIQHHKAHIFSCMIDKEASGPLLGISWDGTGFGEDETIWGGEAFLIGQEQKIQHLATLLAFPLPGSEKAVHEPRRAAFGLIHAMDSPLVFDEWLRNAFSSEERRILFKTLKNKTHAPLCTSMGRLFDAVSALLDCCLINNFEGQAAMALEALAIRARKCPEYLLPIDKNQHPWIIDWRKMVPEIMADKIKGIPVEEIALGFHRALAKCIVSLAHDSGMKKIILTGGVMQNKLLLEDAIRQLREAGLIPLWHEHLPPNDGGIAAGQICSEFLCV